VATPAYILNKTGSELDEMRVSNVDVHQSSDVILRTEGAGVYTTSGLSISFAEYVPTSKYLFTLIYSVSGSTAGATVQFEVIAEGVQVLESLPIVIGNKSYLTVPINLQVDPGVVSGNVDVSVNFKSVAGGTITLHNNEIPAQMIVTEYSQVTGV
jgi:hypothetical protein